MLLMVSRLFQKFRISSRILIADLMLPGASMGFPDGKSKKRTQNIIVIIVSGASDLNLAVGSYEMGAFDFIKKPYIAQELIMYIRKALNISYERRELDHLKKRLMNIPNLEKVMGESSLIKKVLKQVELVALTNMSVIIQGKSGTGKEVIANPHSCKTAKGGINLLWRWIMERYPIHWWKVSCSGMKRVLLQEQ